MVRALASVTVAVGAILAITAAPAGAQADKCAASKLKATGSECDGRVKCLAKAASKGDPLDEACVGKADTKFTNAFAKAEGKGGCSTTGDASAIEDKVDAHVLDLRGELWTDDPAENDCASSKLRAGGKKCSCKLKCRSKAASKDVPIDPACLDKCETKFSSSFVKAEGNGGCTTTGDETAIEDKVDAFVADAAAEIQPVTTSTALPTTTTTTTIPPTCGNGITEAPEECDDGDTTNGDGCSAACVLENTSARCAGIPTVPGTALDTVRVASGLTRPVHLSAPPLDPYRQFVVEQPGTIRIIDNGTLLPDVFLDITGRVRDTGNEEGLLSIAFHPNYESNGLFYVYYVNNNGDLVISRFTVTADPNDADENSEHIITTIPHPTNGNHNGGNLNFGPDGFLYAGTGDGGAGCDPPENAQNDAVRLGKLLRINVATDAITTWAKGLRNPWRFSFDRATADLYIADVGQNAWEEVNFTPAPAPPPASPTSGLNYGWDFYEARHCSSAALPEGSNCSGDPCPMPPTGLTMPVIEYSHAEGCSITGGFAYRGCTMPDLHGRYFYSDACTAFIRSFKGVSGGNAQNLMDNTADVAPGGGLSIDSVSSFGEDARGELYVVDLGGEVFKIVPGS